MILSVVIPTHGKADLLRRTLAALAGQELDAPWEIVVVDDASRDGTAALLAAEARDGAGRLRVVTCEANVGRAAARNRGWQAASGRWVLFLDDDIVAPPGLLAAHLALLRQAPGSGTIGRVATDPALVDAPHFAYLDTRGVARVPSGPVPARYFVTQNAAVPRDALAKAGGFDERFRGWGFEDMELAFRLEARAGTRFLALAAPVPLHSHHHTLDQWLEKKRACGAGALPLLARLHPGRIREMQLHWVLDAPGTPPAGAAVRLLRAAAEGPLPDRLARLARAWPTDRRRRARGFALHARLLDLLVLLNYRRGMVSEGVHS